MTDEQRGVARGMATAVLASTALWLAPLALDGSGLSPHRLPLLALAVLGPGCALVAGIAFVARHRFHDPRAIGGANPPDDVVLLRGRAYLANTLEQAVLATLVYAALAVLLPARWLTVVPLLPIAFVLGRVGFAVGLRRGTARARAFGFGLTFYPTVLGLGAAALSGMAWVVHS